MFMCVPQGRVSCNTAWLSYVASSDLELVIPLLLPPECWNYWPMAPCFVYALLGIELRAS